MPLRLIKKVLKCIQIGAYFLFDEITMKTIHEPFERQLD
jgi:hypothetical protein